VRSPFRHEHTQGRARAEGARDAQALFKAGHGRHGLDPEVVCVRGHTRAETKAPLLRARAAHASKAHGAVGVAALALGIRRARTRRGYGGAVPAP